MRLLQLSRQGQLSLTENIIDGLPPYAILSHTWGADNDEVTFDDLKNGSGKDKPGYAKIEFCGNQARHDGIEHFWVDTCCINKADHSELSETIVSMFNWYQNAAKCYVYLSDVSIGDIPNDETQYAWESDFRSSRWFRRGWTLQELLAPATVEFFSKEGKILGSKKGLKSLVHQITKIPSSALDGAPLSSFTVDERLEWAAERQTKRVEDKAYCLMGIFGLFIPLIYGERENALKRLTEEIDKRLRAPVPRPESPPSPSCGVPFRRDADFVDRGSLLHQIEEKCSAGASRVALVGIGGVGKSQLAIEYCHRVHERSPNTWIFWVYASNADRIEQGYREIAEQAEIAGRKDPQNNIFELVARWLKAEKNGKWLLILDNADDDVLLSTPQASKSKATPGPESSQFKRSISAYLPQSVNGAVLVTTRSSSVATKLAEPRDLITVDPMAETDAMTLLKKKLDAPDVDSDMEDLVNILEYMPLAIVQAAAYIRQKKQRQSHSVRQYIEEFQRSDKSKTRLLDYEAGHLRRDPEAKNSIIISWQISFTHIQELWPSAADLLALMSFFDRQGIPKEALTVRIPAPINSGGDSDEDKDGKEDAQQDTVSGSSNDSDSEQFEQDIDRLQNYSFVSPGANDQTFAMHRLVQLATRKWLAMQGEEERWRSEFCQKLSAVFPIGNYENWNLCEMLLPHAKVAEQQQPADRAHLFDWATLMHNAGWHAICKRNFIEAVRIYSSFIPILEREFGDNLLASRHNLALAYSGQGLLSEAEEIQVDVLATKKRLFGEEHPSTLITMDNLGTTYSKQRRLSEAEKIRVDVLARRKRRFGEEHPSTLTSMNYLASTYHDQGRLSEAEKIQVDVLERIKRVCGEEHPSTLSCTAGLASTYHDQGRLSEAEKIQVDLLERVKRIWGEKHPETLIFMNDLARTMKRQGKNAEATGLMSECVRLRTQVLGAAHAYTLDSLARLAEWQSEGS